MTFIVAWAMSLVQPGRTYAPEQMMNLFWGVAAVQLLVVYAIATTGWRTADDLEKPGLAPALPEQENEAALAAFPSALLGKLPKDFDRDILALETEDHYLRVHTKGGSVLVLMRMADAVALLDPRLGAQVHRRWWVAQMAVRTVRTEGQKLSLWLIDGTLVPVGRTFAAAAKARFADGRNISLPGQAPAADRGPTGSGP
jgi:DNA-binding LytR/AlgR family response regulator